MEEIKEISLNKILRLVLLFIGLLAALFLLANQLTGFLFKAQLLNGNACNVCLATTTKPEVRDCLNNYKNTSRASYPIGNGSWTDPFAEIKVYNLTISP